MRIILFLSCLFFLSGLLPAQNAPATERELIPRELFFTGVQNRDAKIDANGEILYFRKSTDRDQIQRLRIKDHSLLEPVQAPADIVQYVVLDGSPLIYAADSVPHLSHAGQEITLPPGTLRGRIVSGVLDDGSILVELRRGAEEGIFAFDPKDRSLTKRHDLQPHPSLFFDGKGDLTAAYSSNEQGGNTIFHYQNEAWKPFESYAWDPNMFLGGLARVISVSRDGQKIYYTSIENADKTEFWVFDRHADEHRLLAKNDTVDIIPFGASTNLNGDVTSVVALFAESIRKVVDPSISKDIEWLNQQMEGDLSFMQALDGDRKWLVRELSAGPARLFLYDREAKTLDFLLDEYEGLQDQPTPTRKAFGVETRDGLLLPVHVYLPPGSDQDKDGIPDQPLPTVLYVHGGPWVGIVHWNQHFHRRNFQLLADRGYAVINCEFRGSTGLGKEVIEKSYRNWGTAMLYDKVDIAEWAVAQKIAAPGRVGIWGWSYGGYASLAGVALSPETFACAVSMYGITDLPAFLETDFANTDWWHLAVGDLAEKGERKRLAKESPLQQAKQIEAPVLLTTGSLDRRVPQEQVDRMAERLDQLDKEVIYFYYPEEGHDYRDPNSWISFWAVTEQFLRDHLGGEAQPIGGDFERGKTKVVYGEEYIAGKTNAAAGK